MISFQLYLLKISTCFRYLLKKLFWKLASLHCKISELLRTAILKNNQRELLLLSLVNFLSFNMQIFHTFLFNIRNYSPSVSNIQRCEVQLNSTLPKVNNFDIKLKMPWNICFIFYHQHQTKPKRVNASKAHNISVTT